MKTVTVTLTLPVGMPFEIADALHGEAMRLACEEEFEAAMVVQSLAAVCAFAKAASTLTAGPLLILEPGSLTLVKP